MERTVIFKDKQKNIVKIKIKIDKGRLSICGEHGSGCGQCQDSIKPKNKAQQRLIDIWNKWHLNDVHAGTEKQEKALNIAKQKGILKSYDYDKVVDYLKSINLYEDNGYKYGTAWLKRDLPDNIEEELNTICDEIEQIENKNIENQTKLKNTSGEAYKHLIQKYNPYIIALGLSSNLFVEDLEDIEQAGNNLSYGGIDYFVGTDEEAREEAVNYLTEDISFWQDAVNTGTTTDGLEDWAEWVISQDGMGHILNTWDGTEDCQNVNCVDYFIYRR